MVYKKGDRVEYDGKKDWLVEDVYIENGVEMLKMGRTVPLYDTYKNGINQRRKKYEEGPEAGVVYVSSKEVNRIEEDK